MEEEERRSELRRRNSKKEKRTPAVKEEKRMTSRRERESPERLMGMRSKSVGAIVVKQEEEHDAGSLSMWSCRRYEMAKYFRDNLSRHFFKWMN